MHRATQLGGVAELLPTSLEPRQKVNPSRVARFSKYGFYLAKSLFPRGPEILPQNVLTPSRELITLGRLKSWI